MALLPHARKKKERTRTKTCLESENQDIHTNMPREWKSRYSHRTSSIAFCARWMSASKAAILSKTRQSEGFSTSLMGVIRSRSRKNVNFLASKIEKRKFNHGPFFSGYVVPGTPSFDLPTMALPQEQRWLRRATMKMPSYNEDVELQWRCRATMNATILQKMVDARHLHATPLVH